MPSNIPAPILSKMRPKSLKVGETDKYFETLEIMLEQIQDQTGVASGQLSGVLSTVGVLNPASMPPKSIEFLQVSSSVTTQHSVILSCTSDVSVTLNSTPDNDETVYVYNNSNNVTVSSSLQIIGPKGDMGGVDMMSAFRYNENANAWINLSLSARHLRSEKIVYSATDIDVPARSDLTYVIDGVIDMGSQPIVVGSGGVSLRGVGFGVSSITSSVDDFDLFQSVDGGSGNIELRSLELSLDGANSRHLALSDTSGFSSLEWIGVNFQGGSLGYIDGYRQLFGAAIGMFGIADGLEFRSNWVGGSKLTDLIVRGMSPTATLFKAGAGLVFNSRFYCDGNIDLIGATSSVCDFSSGNFGKDSLFQMTNSQITRSGAFDTQDAFYFPNASEKDLTSLWRGNIGIDNTKKGGLWDLTTETATVVAAADTQYKLAGTTTYSDLTHFTGAADNAYTLASQIAESFDIEGSISIRGQAGDLVTLYVRKWDDSASAYVDIYQKTKEIINYAGLNDRNAFTFFTRADMSINDRIELWVSVDAARDVTLEAGSITRIRS